MIIQIVICNRNAKVFLCIKSISYFTKSDICEMEREESLSTRHIKYDRERATDRVVMKDSA